MRFTDEQERAVVARGTNLLLSAAAGSGKTTVLVGRALSLILEDGVDIDRMLIVTFTRAAAADMRAKLTDRLSEAAASGDERCARQLLRLERASITTLHSFCAEFLRENFELAGVEPNFRVLDDSEANRLRERALDKAMEEAYRAMGSDMEKLDYGRGPRGVRILAEGLMNWLDERAEPEAWLAAASDCSEETVRKWTEVMVASSRAAVMRARTHLSLARSIPDCPAHYVSAIDKDLDAISLILREAEYEPLRRAIGDFKATTPRGRNAGASEETMAEIKNLREKAKKELSSAAILEYPLLQSISDAKETVEELKTLGKIALSAREIFRELKSDKGGVTYSDLEQMTLAALSRPEARSLMREKYDHVFVDEYQDTSELQEALVRRVAREDNLFMVGDVKQSIYRFRLAEPELFTEKYTAYRDGAGGRLLPLTRNFRSSKSVIDFVNAVFSHVMTGGDSEIEYDDAARLRPGIEGNSGAPVELHFFEEQKGAPRKDPEANFIARRILDAKKSDPSLKWSDIAVITRTGESAFSKLMPALLAHGIPAYAGGLGGLYNSAEMLLATSLIRLIVNARSDVELIGVLRSGLFGLSAEELALIRIASPEGSFYDAARAGVEIPGETGEKLRDFWEKLDGWRLYSAAASPGDVVRRALSESGLTLFAAALPGGEQRTGNLARLSDQADRFGREISGSLERFLSHIEKQAEKGEGESASILSEADDVVRLMTVHHSKGLEFRLVIGAFLDRRYAGREKASNLAVHRDLGAGFRYCDPVLATRRNTLPMAAINEKRQLEDAAEEMRVLYVLLTRPREQLVLTATTGRRELEEIRWRAVGESIPSANSHLSLMMGALSRAQQEGETADYRVTWHEPDEPDQYEAPAAKQEESTDVDLSALTWVYPDEGDADRPMKLTASGLSRQIEGPDEMEELTPRPAFLSDETGSLTASERGTACHAVLRRMDLSALRGKTEFEMSLLVQATIREMEEIGILREAEAASVSPRQIARFYASAAGQALLRAEEIHREWPFNVMMSVREALHRDDDGEILVQGVVDCCYLEDGEWVLLDYKTDRARDLDSVREHYKMQLATYALALERITGIRVKKKLLCLVAMDLVLEV